MCHIVYVKQPSETDAFNLYDIQRSMLPIFANLNFTPLQYGHHWDGNCRSWIILGAAVNGARVSAAIIMIWLGLCHITMWHNQSPWLTTSSSLPGTYWSTSNRVFSR